MALRSPWMLVMWREVRLGNLWNRVGINGSVGSDIVKEDRRRLVMERNCLEARERGSVWWWLSSSPSTRNVQMDFQQSSGVVLLAVGVFHVNELYGCRQGSQ
ncbi:hypothetical protein A2U01_0047583 [Trifolium medium]|uniref:Uncharacterized protein n=1 Tax=Trifolium medium TaxID=97028 RepID=A0A392QQ69_9FABA|nr:hypothetical protein [Trifolium medium]